MAEIALESLRPDIAQLVEAAGKPRDAENRVLTLMSALHEANQKYEPQLRAILAASLGDEQGDSTSDPVRGGRRVEWIRQAVAPLRDEIPPDTHDTLISALTVIAGYDAFRMLRQMRDLPPAEIERVIRWMASALIRAAKKDSRHD